MNASRRCGLVSTSLFCLPIFLVACTQTRTESSVPVAARNAEREQLLRTVLQRFHAESRFPGAVAGAWFADNSTVVVAVGEADREVKTPMTNASLLHAGSVGKTLFAALVLQLVDEGRVALDAKVSRYLGIESWYAALPNSDAITVRMLLNHTSGLPEYSSDFMGALVSNPGLGRTPLDAVKSSLGAPAKFPAGTAFGYSDINYQVLQLLAEKVTGKSAYDEISRRLLGPHQLVNIKPATRKAIPGLVQAYAGKDFFLGFDAALKDGQLILDPNFEGGGGGFVSNAGDLARWIPLFVQGKAFSARLLPEALRGVPAGQMDVGKDALAGLGIEMAPSPLGVAYGHGGFFPGYLSLVLWYPDAGVSVAIQVNSSAEGGLARPLREVLLEAAQALGIQKEPS
jgi:D-alanyl-D-alanine carboxypeptidase